MRFWVAITVNLVLERPWVDGLNLSTRSGSQDGQLWSERIAMLVCQEFTLIAFLNWMSDTDSMRPMYIHVGKITYKHTC